MACLFTDLNITVVQDFYWIHEKMLRKVKVIGVSQPALRRRQWHLTLVLLPGKSHGWRSLEGCSPWGCEELDTTERLHFHFHALEKEMATHSSTLDWKIPWMEEPGRLQSMGLRRVEIGRAHV